MVQHTRLGYGYTIGYCIDIRQNCYILCESKSNNKFAWYDGNSKLIKTIGLTIVG